MINLNKNMLKFALLILICGISNVARANQPNIVLIYVDDLPWYATSVKMEDGNDESFTQWQRTPNLERLAAQGITFSRAFAPAGVCAPSRACMQLGQFTVNSRYTGNTGTGKGLIYKDNGDLLINEEPGVDEQKSKYMLNEPRSIVNLPRERTTIGEAMQSLGYSTALFGKWHIYGGGPEAHGYDFSNGDTNNDPGKSLDPDNDPKLMFSINDDAIEFIRNSTAASIPFFVTLSHYATHNKAQSRPQTLQYYEGVSEIDNYLTNSNDAQKAREMSAMLEDLDTTVGVLMDELEALGIADNTYIVFTADNGKGWKTGSNGLRGTKWWLWDNAIRVPMIVSGPNIPLGQRSDVNVVHTDFFPTFYAIGGGLEENLPSDLDGQNLVSLIENPIVEPQWANRKLYFHYPHNRNSTPHSAVVRGDKKALWFYENTDLLYYYNTNKDPYESFNLWSSKLSQAERLRNNFYTYADKVRKDDFIYPTENPNWNAKSVPFDPDVDIPPIKQWTPSNLK